MNRKTLGKVVFGVIIAAVVVFAAITIWGNWFQDTPGQVKMPDSKDAQYSLTVEDTRTVLFADRVEVFGETPGSRTFIINEYWELQGRSFVYKSSTLVMSEKVFGEVTLKKR